MNHKKELLRGLWVDPKFEIHRSPMSGSWFGGGGGGFEA